MTKTQGLTFYWAVALQIL